MLEQLEIMSTPPADGTAPAFNGMTNIPENHAVILNISYCEPNTQGSDRINVTPDDKRRRIPVVTLAAMRGNRMVTDGTLRAALQAVANHCGPQVRGGPNRTLDQLERMSTQRVGDGQFNVALVYDQVRYHNYLYRAMPLDDSQGAPDGDGGPPDGGGPPDLNGAPGGGGRPGVGGPPDSGNPPDDDGLPRGGLDRRRNGPVDLTGPTSPVVQGIMQSLEEESRRGRTRERGGGQLVSPPSPQPGRGRRSRNENREESREERHRSNMPSCPITYEPMRDPVVAADGHTYERTAIARWLLTSNRSPLTGLILPHRQLVPNYMLRSSFGRDTPQLLPNMPFCPITQEPMRDPVVAADGHTYERTAIVRWLRANDRSPLTGLILPHRELVPNYTLLSSLRDQQLAGISGSDASGGRRLPWRKTPSQSCRTRNT